MPEPFNPGKMDISTQQDSFTKDGHGSQEEKDAPFLKEKDFLLKKAPQLIRKGEKGVFAVAKKLGLDAYDYLGTLESLARILLTITNDFDKGAVKTLDAIADAFKKEGLEDYMHWSHQVCHLIEDYGKKDKQSFLDTAQSREVLTKLVDESVKRQKESRDDIGCSPRIVGPIAMFNLVEAGLDKLDVPYPYKPDSLKDEDYMEIMKDKLDDDYDFLSRAFLSSDTPAGCLKLILEKREPLPEIFSPERQIEVLQALEKHLGKELLDHYVKHVYHPNGQSTDYAELTQNFQKSKEAHEVVEGVYVDVEGTLIEDHWGKHELNEGLIKAIEGFEREGKKIIIFTGGNRETLEEELKRLGVPERFLPIRSKSDYRGKVLGALIDDTPPEYQGFKALKRYRKNGREIK